MSQIALPQLDLPAWERQRTQEEIDTAFARARAAYERKRKAIEAKYPPGTVVVVDGDDESGETFTAGPDVLTVEQEHYRRFKKPFLSTCIFRVGED